MKVFFRLIICFLSFFFVFVGGDENKTKDVSSRYINDFENNSTSFEPVYDYDATKTVIDDKIKTPIQNVQKEESEPEIYPDPEDFHKKLLNKSRINNRHDENVIKIYTTRIRQAKKDQSGRYLKDNTSQAIDLNNDDLNGHDFIDSIMFIYYYGKNSTMKRDLGGNIIVIGSVFGLAAQILSIILVFLRNRRTRKVNAFFPITINLLLVLCLSNLLFIVGVQSNKNAIKCELIALVLHYLYLTTSFWCFVYIFVIYDLIINESLRMKMKYIMLMAYSVPAIYVMFSYAANTNSLEYHKYCFMSIHKNMIINFLIPIFMLIVLTTILGTICLKHISAKNRETNRDMLCESIDSQSNGIANVILNATTNSCNIEKFLSDKEILQSYYMKTSTFTNQMRCCEEQNGEENYFKSRTDLYDSKFDIGQLSLADLSDSSSTASSHDFTNFKNATKFALFFQPMFSICWFIAVLALENSLESYVFPTVFAICFNILNWSILLKSRNILPFMKQFYGIEEHPGDVVNEHEDDELEEDQLARKDSKNSKNNKNLLNQLFQNNDNMIPAVHRTDQIPLLYQSHFNHHKSIANLGPAISAEFQFEKHKVHRSEHDLLFQHQQFSSIGMDVIGYQHAIRNSWDTNLDRVSTISN